MIIGGFERITLGAGLAFRRREDLQAELSLRTAKHEDTSRRYLQSGAASEPPAQIPNPKPKPQTPNPDQPKGPKNPESLRHGSHGFGRGRRLLLLS